MSTEKTFEETKKSGKKKLKKFKEEGNDMSYVCCH